MITPMSWRQHLWRRIFPAIGILALVITAVPARLPAAPEAKSPAVVPAYSFSAPTADTGKMVSLADFRGKTAVVIDFYQNDCDTCRIGFPHLVELSKTYQGKGIEFIGIPLETEKPAAGQWKKEYKADFPFLFDPGFTIAKAFQVKVTPTTFFIDRDGKIVQSIISYDQGTFDKAIRALGPTS